MKIPVGTATVGLAVLVDTLEEADEIRKLRNRLGVAGKIEIKTDENNNDLICAVISTSKVKQIIEDLVVSAICIREHFTSDVDEVKWIEEGDGPNEPPTT